VQAVLAELGLADRSDGELIEALNKIDLLAPNGRTNLFAEAACHRQWTPVSAVTGEGCEALLALIDRQLDETTGSLRIDIPLADGRTLAWIYRHGAVLGRRDDDDAAHLSVRLSPADIARLRHRQRLH
jgi:GTP-binding protein HflX